MQSSLFLKKKKVGDCISSIPSFPKKFENGIETISIFLEIKFLTLEYFNNWSISILSFLILETLSDCNAKKTLFDVSKKANALSKPEYFVPIILSLF